MKLCAIQVSRLNYVNNYRSLESLCPGILLCWSSMVLVTRVVIEKMLNTNKALGLSRISTDTSLLMDKLIRPVFTLEVNHKIVPGLVTVGKYDGSHPCITAATTADKVSAFLHFLIKIQTRNYRSSYTVRIGRLPTRLADWSGRKPTEKSPL